MRWTVLFAAGLLAGCGGGAPLTALVEAKTEARKPDKPAVAEAPKDRVDVPGFAGATAWLNVDHAITKEELRGRVVVVDFWTSCCINCLHTLPRLAALEERFRGQPVVVIGVHSPKFDEEKAVDRLRDVVLDQHLTHPIAVDGDMAIWHGWGVEGWPTVAVLDVDGRALWAASGEPDSEELASLVTRALDEGRAAGKLAKGELPGLRAEKDGSGALRYPGKVVGLASGGLAIADTGHHRVVITDGKGGAEAVGTGLAGKLDGGYGEASFERPEGMAEIGADLYVADAGSHTIRKIDRKARAVTTVAGTGALAAGQLAFDEKPALTVGLRSPWDLLALKGKLVIALAGSHQLGVYDPAHGTIRALAGNGREARVDGTIFEASFAQPSGLATDGKEIFVLDSETSSVRGVDIAHGHVRTVVGKDLFVFGDVDGDQDTARLQHPIGLGYAGGALWVADSYNSKVKRVDPASGATRSVLGGDGELGEPAGLAAGVGALWIADTNHHRVVRWPVAGGKAEPIALGDLRAPANGVALAAAPSRPAVDPRDPVVTLGALRIPPGKATRVHVGWTVPGGTGVNEAAPFRVVWTDERGLTRAPADTRSTGAAVKDGFDVEVEPAAGQQQATLTGVLDMVICDIAEHRVCLPVRRTVEASFTVGDGAPAAEARITLPAAR